MISLAVPSFGGGPASLFGLWAARRHQHTHAIFNWILVETNPTLRPVTSALSGCLFRRPDKRFRQVNSHCPGPACHRAQSHFRKTICSVKQTHLAQLSLLPPKSRTTTLGPFGEVVRQTGDMAKANPFRFSTKFWDEETELVYYGYRYYSPALGRWINRDPIEEEGGNNLYAFVVNNPISSFDPLGEFTAAEQETAMGIGLALGGATIAGITLNTVREKIGNWNTMQEAIYTSSSSAADDDMAEDLQGLNADLSGIANSPFLEPDDDGPNKGPGKKSGDQRKNLEKLKNFYKAKLKGKQLEKFKELIEKGKVGEQYSTKEALKQAFEEASQVVP